MCLKRSNGADSKRCVRPCLHRLALGLKVNRTVRMAVLTSGFTQSTQRDLLPLFNASIGRVKLSASKNYGNFSGVMASHKLARGTYATTSTFTQDAQAFAKANGINTMDGPRLLKQIATRTPEQQKQLLDMAFEGE